MDDDFINDHNFGKFPLNDFLCKQWKVWESQVFIMQDFLSYKVR